MSRWLVIIVAVIVGYVIARTNITKKLGLPV